MEKFWAVILIFVIVAAGGLLYVNQVYNPQKETQMAMADTANQTLSAVKLEMGNNTTNTVVDAEDVESTVKTFCDEAGNSVAITVKTEGLEKTYTDSSDGIEDQLKSETCMFLKSQKKDGDEIESIRFTYIPE